MALRTPASVVNAITTVPIACMAVTRIVENIEYTQINRLHFTGETILWGICIFVHILRDFNVIEPEVFYWGAAIFILIMCMLSTFVKQLFLVIILPLLLLPFSIYICIVKILNGKVDIAIDEIKKLYKDIIEADDNLVVLPFDEEFSEEDWAEKL